MQTSHFEVHIASSAADATQGRDGTTQRESARSGSNFGWPWLITRVGLPGNWHVLHHLPMNSHNGVHNAANNLLDPKLGPEPGISNPKSKSPHQRKRNEWRDARSDHGRDAEPDIGRETLDLPACFTRQRTGCVWALSFEPRMTTI
jgi:hypothetical protein